MAIQAHLAELERKHRILESELHDALRHLSTDDTRIAELKRRKLISRTRSNDLSSPQPGPSTKLSTSPLTFRVMEWVAVLLLLPVCAGGAPNDSASYRPKGTLRSIAVACFN